MHTELSEQNNKRLNNTYEIVSKVGFLIGVKKEVFENPHEPLALSWFDELRQDQNARIIRNYVSFAQSYFRNIRQLFRKYITT